MSLINDALKKAQRQRTEGSPADAAPIPGGAPVTKRAEPRSANTVVLIASGALVLVVLSVVATVFLVNRPKPQPVVAKTTPVANANKTATTTEVSSPALVPPNLTPPAPKPASETVAEAAPAAVVPPAPSPSKPEVKETSKSDRVAETKTTKTTPPPVASKSPDAKTASSAPNTPSLSPAPPSTPTAKAANSSAATNLPTPPAQAEAPAAATTSATATASKPDERIVAFVENVKVAGIRSSGNESRVLMNDRVFRVNDIVERTLGVRLVKVAVDSLTFADANGVTYVKYF